VEKDVIICVAVKLILFVLIFQVAERVIATEIKPVILFLLLVIILLTLAVLVSSRND